MNGANYETTVDFNNGDYFTFSTDPAMTNTAPTITSGNSVSILENADGGDDGDRQWHGPDHLQHCGWCDAVLFTIDENTGKLSFPGCTGLREPR
ncbi:MAG: hypothetical protein R2932_16675 [Caldilineaceae bacterium]